MDRSFRFNTFLYERMIVFLGLANFQRPSMKKRQSIFNQIAYENTVILNELDKRNIGNAQSSIISRIAPTNPCFFRDM